MKKITNNEDQKYEYVSDNKSKVLDQNESKKLGIPKNESEESTYKIVDPKKRMQLYIIIAISLVLVIGLIVINQTRTRTQKSDVVESLSYSDTSNTETDVAKENNTTKNNKLTETTAKNSLTTNKVRVLPTYSIVGSWKGDESNTSISFDGKGNFTYNWKYSKKNTIVYKGSYILRTGESAYEALGLSIDDISNIFHISKQDINEANVMYIDCKPTEFSANGEPFKPVQKSEDESTNPIFTHLVYMTTDNNDSVIAKYYDEITQSVCILNNYENK